MRYFKTFSTLILCYFFSFHFIVLAGETHLEEFTMRAAFDFGSGAMKMQVAIIDTQNNRIVGEPLLAKYTSLGLTEDVAVNEGCISDEMVQKALNILQGFKEDALKVTNQKGYSSIQFTGVATAVFRKARNGNDVLQIFEEKLGIKFQILPQEEEGKLGFLTAKALYPDVAETSLLAWDSGNGSFQMTIKEFDNYTVFQGPLGHGNVRILLSKEIRNGSILQTNESGNPILQDEAIILTEKINALLPTLPEWLKERLNSEGIVIATFGDGESIFALAAQAKTSLVGTREKVLEATISFSDIQEIVDAYIEKDDKVFNDVGLRIKTLTGALFLSAVMKHYGIQFIHYKNSIGNTPGMLIAPQLWDERISSCVVTQE